MGLDLLESGASFDELRLEEVDGRLEYSRHGVGTRVNGGDERNPEVVGHGGQVLYILRRWKWVGKSDGST
jgi:hypothetical protein